MTEQEIIKLGTEMMFNALIISLPLLGVGLVVGVMISVFQAATQINEQTLTIVPKLLVVGLTIIFLMPWLVEHILDLTHRLLTDLPNVAKSVK
ncbi:MAG: flagellar biosynthesis protein FliQ [Candidatus Hinthialibacter antarcticus]|nr:flagellar biosynthesis protein FliQ [Candidatus Hinthialibacter antarcticus]